MGLLVLFVRVLSISVGVDLCSQLHIAVVYVPTGNTFSALLAVGPGGMELSGYEIALSLPLTERKGKKSNTIT